jgi:hypothetical protein
MSAPFGLYDKFAIDETAERPGSIRFSADENAFAGRMRLKMRERLAVKVSFESGATLRRTDVGYELRKRPCPALLESFSPAAAVKKSVNKLAQLCPIFYLARNGTLFHFGYRSSIQDERIGELHRERHRSMVAFCYPKCNFLGAAL